MSVFKHLTESIMTIIGLNSYYIAHIYDFDRDLHTAVEGGESLGWTSVWMGARRGGRVRYGKGPTRQSSRVLSCMLL